ncbi:hypothetical protein HNQ53_002908 [Microbulbifer hydrolyticus]|uniref:Uncharacterized protein n=1 Tax=Microbulbifer hydrolyticus TaxID=48074 RepID=A0AA89PEV7_9GAMM|nr:hypothetical protein [Microbulbifer hydrolyticus]
MAVLWNYTTKIYGLIAILFLWVGGQWCFWESGDVHVADASESQRPHLTFVYSVVLRNNVLII